MSFIHVSQLRRTIIAAIIPSFKRVKNHSEHAQEREEHEGRGTDERSLAKGNCTRDAKNPSRKAERSTKNAPTPTSPYIIQRTLDPAASIWALSLLPSSHSCLIPSFSCIEPSHHYSFSLCPRALDTLERPRPPFSIRFCMCCICPKNQAAPRDTYYEYFIARL